MELLARSIGVGVLVLLVGTIPRNLLFAANLRFLPIIPWSVPVVAVWIWIVWQYLKRAGGLRANRISLRMWLWALLAGGSAIVALVLALRIANHFIVLPQQQLPDLRSVPATTVIALLLIAAPVAGIVEEAAFRGYMQTPLERTYGLPAAILITGTVFAIVHLDFRPILWPYYVAVAAIYGSVTYFTNSIFPAIVLHTSGNLYSNFDLWLRGHAEWQTSALAEPSAPGGDFWVVVAWLAVVAATSVWAYSRLAVQACSHSAPVGRVGPVEQEDSHS